MFAKIHESPLIIAMLTTVGKKSEQYDFKSVSDVTYNLWGTFVQTRRRSLHPHFL